jgi:hypothetical protein
MINIEVYTPKKMQCQRKAKDIYRKMASRRGEMSRAVVNMLVMLEKWMMDAAPDVPVAVADCEP